MSNEDLHPDDEEDDGTFPAEQPTVDATKSTTAHKQRVKQISEHEKLCAFWSSVLRNPTGQRVIWQMLTDLHTFEDERFGTGPNGFPAPEATLHARGQRDFGLRFYRTLVKFDREAVFAMHDAFDAAFAKPKLRTPKKSND